MYQPDVLEVSDDPGGVCSNVGVEEESHVGFVLFEVLVLARTNLDLSNHVDVVLDLGGDRWGLSVVIAGLVHIGGDSRVSARQDSDRFVQLDTLGFVSLDLRGVADFGSNKVVLILLRLLGWQHSLAEGANTLHGLVKSLPSLLVAVLHDAFDVIVVVVLKGTLCVVSDRVLKRVEEILVVRDIAVVLIVTVDAVDAADPARLTL